MANLPMEEDKWGDIAVNDPARRANYSGVTGAQTGYCTDTLDELWASASTFFFAVYHDRQWQQRTRQLWKPKHLFYIFLMYIHSYPAKDRCVDVLRTKRVAGVPYDTFFRTVMPLARNWNQGISHIRWNDRLDPMNHHPFFPYDTTVIWDTTCFRVQKSRDWTFARNTVNGHYDFPCYLVLIGITFLGQIVYASGLMRSVAYDAHIFEDTAYLHPQFDWEMNIGDGHFATCPRFFTPEQATGGRTLSSAEATWNEWIQLPRSRIEHLNSVTKSHAMFRGEPFRGWVRNLKVFVNVSLHAAAAQQRMNQKNRGDRYAGFGPWRHGP
mmetsp:Transcript_52285/g.119278  ORF Transcript_52285/g.119278 Transcript_52285/m.119278 type:complete len:325 (-) Transcript_52285:538-1512(-)